MGLGAWIWERDQALFAAAGYDSWAIDLPGHGKFADENPTFAEVVEQVREAVNSLEGPVVVVGHSVGGLIAQRLASEVDLEAIVLLCPTPPKEVPIIPTKYSVKSALGALPALVMGKRITFPDSVYEGAGLSALPSSERARILGKIMSWPNRLTKELAFKRPSVQPSSIPVLICFGGLDTIIPLRSSRLIGEYHNCAITWRFDDVGHFPTLEPAGERIATAVIDWLARPRGRRILEIDAFKPKEGVGYDARMAAAPVRRSDTKFGKKKKRKS
jgi:pimeloyl-ACP methyl ester carboxylesterase